MEAKELMIGDIVLHHKTHELLSIDKLKKPIDEYIRIESLVEEGVNEVYSQGDIDWIGYDEIEPVPLTEEILEKNGWEKLGDRFLFRHDYVPFYIGISDAYPFEKMFVSIRTERPIIAMLYVHEAQHALRLCGFDDLADNLKIEEVKK